MTLHTGSSPKLNPGSSRNDVIPEDVDALLAREMNQMSFEERELVYEEVHGCDSIIQETPTFVRMKLDALEFEIQQIQDKPAYRTAEMMSKEYVNDTKFRLMFLRAERFDEKLAAIRLIKFLEGKMEFFGAETLTRPIYMTDLNEEELAIVKSGRMQCIPARDRSGRAVSADIKMDQMPEYSNLDNLLRAFLYIMFAIAEDEETQKRGMVGLFYFSATLEFARDLHQRKAKLMAWLPVRYGGAHICSNDGRLLALKAFLMLAIGQRHRARLRIHQGTHTEAQYSLMAFGVPVSALPVTYEGDVKLAAHARWIAKRLVKEKQLQQGGEFHGIDLPGVNDVLLGRGKTVQDHCGNLKMRYIIEMYMDKYKRAPKLAKSDVSSEVVREVKKHGGLFLKRNKDGWWEVVSDETAREKVSMTFRTSITSNGSKLRDFHTIQRSDETSHLAKRPKIMAEESSCFSVPLSGTYQL